MLYTAYVNGVIATTRLKRLGCVELTIYRLELFQFTRPRLVAEGTFPHALCRCKMQWVKKYCMLVGWTGCHCSPEITTGWLDKRGGRFLNIVKPPPKHAALEL